MKFVDLKTFKGQWLLNVELIGQVEPDTVFQENGLNSRITLISGVEVLVKETTKDVHWAIMRAQATEIPTK
jgi:uncharacterized protein YlzI (FlbEa/FlbD family)